MNMFENISQEGGLRIDKHYWTLDKPMVPLSTCHLGLSLGRHILLKLEPSYDCLHNALSTQL